MNALQGVQVNAGALYTAIEFAAAFACAVAAAGPVGALVMKPDTA
jgi:hypothetical protein